MERGRRLVVGAVGLAVMLLTAGLVLRAAGDGGDGVGLDATASSIDALSGDLEDLGALGEPGDVPPGAGIEPGAPAPSAVPAFDPAVPPGLGDPLATLPAP